LQSIFEFDQGSAKTRFQIWQAAMDAIRDRPVFGFGADTFRLIFPRYKPVENVADAGYLSVADNVHNYPLQLAAALGIPGFLLLYGMFGYAAYLSAPLVFKREQNSPVADRLILAGFWAGCAGYIAHLMFGLSVTGTTVLLWVAMAAVLAPLARTVQLPKPSWGPAAATVSVALAAALLIGNVVYVVADNHYLTARVIRQGSERVLEAETAVRLNPLNDMYRAELGMAHMDTFISAVQRMVGSAETAGEPAARAQAEQAFTAAETTMLETIEFVPWEYDNYVFLANLYTAAGDYLDPSYYDKAVAVARRGIEEMGFRYGPALRFQLARAQYARGEDAEAYEQLGIAVGMDERYVEGQVLYASVARHLGELEVARDAMKKALERQPDYPGLADALAEVEASLTVGE
ncbi:MAG: O-antigen ligase family protein, partial [Actinomycetota bacterium]|nr:O-antigen ligase family protein [Actinomycetota bacterium]